MIRKISDCHQPAHGPLQRHFITYDLSARSNPRRTPNVQNSNGRVNLSNQDLLKADQTVSDASDYGSARITGDDVASIFTNKRHSRLRNTEWITVKKCPREGQGLSPEPYLAFDLPDNCSDR